VKKSKNNREKEMIVKGRGRIKSGSGRRRWERKRERGRVRNGSEWLKKKKSKNEKGVKGSVDRVRIGIWGVGNKSKRSVE